MTGEQVGLWVDPVQVKFDELLIADGLETVELMVVGKVWGWGLMKGILLGLIVTARGDDL